MRWLLGVIFLGFISLGLPDGTLGVAWPLVYPELGVAVGMAGVLMTIATVLTAIAGFSSGRIVARWGTGPVLVTSGLLTSAGLFTLALAPGLPWLVLAMLPLGFGAGAVDAALNGFVARHYEARQMNWLHACWGVGATLGPLLMGEAIAQSHGWRGGYALIGAIQLGLALLFFCTLHGWRGVPPRMTTSSVAAAPACTRRGANSVEGWISPALFLVYTGAEYTIGLWAGTILVLERGVSAGGAALWTAFYFGAIALGRVLVGFFVGRWGNRITVRVGLCLALAGQVAFGFTGSSPWAAVALAAIGLGLAPVYPGLMHEVPRRFAPEAVQTIIGRQSGAGALGVAVLPALAGVFAPQALNAIVALAGGATLVLLAGVLWLDSRTAA